MVILADAADVGWLSPAFITSLAVLITAVTGLVIAIRTGQKAAVAQAITAQQVAETHDTVQKQADMLPQVVTNTNGQVQALRATIDSLQAQHQQSLVDRIVTLEGLLAKAGKRSTDPPAGLPASVETATWVPPTT